MEKLKILKKKARNGEGEWTSSFSGEQKVNLELKKLTSSAGWVAAGSRKMVSSAKSKSPSSSRASTPSNTSSTGKKRGRKKKKDGKQKFKMVLEKDDAFEVDYVSPEEDENTEDSEAESKPVSDVSEEEFSVGEEEDDLSSLEDCSVLLDDDFSDIEPDEDLPALELPESSRDLLVPNHLVLPALGIYETLRHFRSLLRISPMLFEDFCAALVDESTNILLTECYIAVLKSILREEDAAGTQFGPPDQKDSKDTAFSFLDHMTWPEITRAYLESTGDHSEALQIIRDPKFPRVKVDQKILVLKTLTDIYLASNKVRDKLMTDGVIHYDDHCRVCHKLGDLLCCETCPAVYHLACCDPPLAEVPDDEWQCEICRVHKLNGVFNCEPRHEFKGQYLRHDPIGVDRHGNKYWFLVRRLIVEESEGIRYYTTQEQFESLRSVLDPERYEMVLCEALKDIADDFQKYSCITCDLTEEAVPDEKTSLYLNALNARVKREQDEKKRKREEEIKKKQEEEKKRKEEEEAKKKQEEEEKKRKEEEEAKKKQEEDEKKRKEEEIKKKQEEEEKKGREEEEVKEKQEEDEKNRMNEDDKKAESERLEEKKDAEGMDVDQVEKPEEEKNAEDQSKSTESMDIEQKKPADVGTNQTTASTDALTESKPSVATNASTATTSLPSTPVTPSSTITKIVTPSSTVTPTVPKIVVPGQTRNIQVIKLGQNVTPRPSQPVPTNLKTLFVLNKDGTRTPITLGPAGKILAAGNSQTPGNRQILVLNSAKVTLPKVNRELKKLQFTGAGPKTADMLNAQGQGPQLRQRIAVTKPAQEETPPAPKRPLTHDEESELYFKLGEDEGYRHYVNHYTDNTLALNKYQHKEERDRERYLSYKFSLSGEGEFKWMGDVLGNETTMLATLRNTLLHLEHQIPLCFMHTKWGRYRNAWGKMVMSCDTPQGFSAALGILEMATRVVVKRSIWKNSSGLTRLKRVTVGEKEDWDKKRKHRTRVEEDESNRNAIWCKYPFPLRCTLVWKGRGEEYRMTGYGGWMWISAARISKMRQSRKKPFTIVHDVTKDTVMDVTSNEGDKKDMIDLDTDSEKSTTSTVTTKSADLSEDRGIFDTLVQEATNQPIVTSPKTMTSSIVSMETKMTPSPVKSDVKIQLGGSENDNQTVTSSVNNDYTCDEIISSCDVINVSENLLKRTRLYNKKWAASKVDVFLGWRMVQHDKDNPTEKPTDPKPITTNASPAVTSANNVKQPEPMNKATNGPEVAETKPEIVPKIEEDLGAMDVDPPVAGQGNAAVKQEALGPVVNGPNSTDSKSGLFTNEPTTVSLGVNHSKSRTVCGGFAPTVIKAAATEHDENLSISTASGANFVSPPNSDGVASTASTTAKTEATDLENFTVAAENGSHPISVSNSDAVPSNATAIIKTEATKINESSPAPSAENKLASVEGNQPTSTSLSATNSDSVALTVATTFKTEATDLESLPISSVDGNLTTSAPDSINTSNSASAMTKTDTNDSHVPTAQTQNTSDGPAPSRPVAGPQNTDSADKTRPVVVDPESKIIEIKEEYVPVQQPNGEVETAQNESATSAKSLGSLMEVAGAQAEITPVEPECLDGIKMETQALSQPNGDLDKNEGTSEPDIEATVDTEATGSSIGATSSTDCKTVMENQSSVDTSTLAKTGIDATVGTDAMASSIGAASSTESNTVPENEPSMDTGTSVEPGIDATVGTDAMASSIGAALSTESNTVLENELSMGSSTSAKTGIDATVGTDAMASSIGAALSTEPKSELGNVSSIDTSTSMKLGDGTTVGADATEINTMPESESSMDTSTSAMPGIDATASSIGATLCTESKTVLENEFSMDTSTSVEPGIDATVGTDATASSIGAALSTESNTVPENESSINTSTSAKPGIDATVGTDATASSIGAALSTESNTVPENESSIDTSTSAKPGIEATVGTEAMASSIGITSCTESKAVPKNESFMDTSTSLDVASDIVTTEESMEVADSVIETTKTTMTEGNQVVTVVETQTTTITKTTSVTTTITSTNGGTKIVGTQATSGADNNVVEIAEMTSTALSSGTTTSQLNDFAQQPTVSIEILPHLASTKHVALVTLPRIEFKQGKATVVSVQQRVRVSRMSRAQRILRKKNNSPLVPTQKTWKLERLKKTSAAQKKEMKLPLPWQFSSSKLNKKKSIFRLPAQILRKLAVSGGQFAYRAGFTFGAKWFSGLEQYWLYPCPRPTFSLTWRYKIQNVTTYATAAHLLRIFWHAIKWDKMTMRPQTDDVVHTITTDDEIITTELLKRKDDLRSGLHSEYFIRKITVPILDPEEEALRAIKPAEGYTPSRKGLRSRRSLMLRDRPNKSSETQVKEVWVSEEQVELWQIRQFDTMLKQQSQVNKPTNVLHSGGNTFVATPSGGILPTIQKRTEDAAGPGFSIVRLPLHQNAQMLQKSLGGVQSPLSPRSYIGKSPVQKIIVQPPKQQFTSYKTVGDKQAIIRSAQGGAQYIVQGGKLMKPIIIKAGSQIVTSTAQNKTPLRPQDQAFKFQQQPPIVPSFKKSPVIAPRAAPSLPQTQIKLSTTQLASLLKAGSASPVKVSVTLGNGKSGVGQIQLIPPGSQVTPSSGQQLMQTRVGGEVRKFLFTLISEAAPAAPSPVNEVSLQTASLSQRLQQIHRRQLLGTNRNTDMKKLLTDKDPLWGSRPQAPDRTSISSHEAERPKRKGFSRLQREEGQRQTVVAQVMKSILDRIEKREELEMRKKKKEEAAMRKEQNEQIKVHNRQTQFLHKHRDQLRQEILKRRAIVEKYLTHAVKNELRDDQRKQRRSGSGSDLSLSPTSKRPKKSQGNAIVTSAVLTENNARRLLGKQAAAKRRRTNSPPPDSKKRKMISTTQIKKEGKLYCVCLTPYDPTRFYIGCDLCLNWFHGSCVGIPESRAKMMSEWICEECQKAKEEPAQELYCLCRTPYDDAKFYIGCDICQDWYHGGCVGVSEKEAETIDFYTCPRCIEKKRGESDRLEENLLTRSDRIELTKIIKSLRAHKMAWPFLQPVSKIEVPHYYNVIKKPMDLGTIMNKLSSYALLSELMGDVSLIFDNCRMFNGADSALAKCAEIVESVFVGRMREYRSRRKSSG